MSDDGWAAKNRQLAEVLGYTTRSIPAKGWRWTSQGVAQVYELIQPDGKYVRVYREHDIDAEWETEAEAWEQLPDFYSSVDACEQLLPGNFDVVIHSRVMGGYRAALCNDVPPLGCKGRWEGEGVSRAEALANAALAWAQALHADAGKGTG